MDMKAIREAAKKVPPALPPPLSLMAIGTFYITFFLIIMALKSLAICVGTLFAASLRKITESDYQKKPVPIP